MAREDTYSRELLGLPAETFESPRLMFRPMTLDDEPEFWAMISDPDVMRYIGVDVATDREKARQDYTEDFKKGERFRFFFAMLDKEAGAGQADKMIGLYIFRPTEDGRFVEIGYWFMPRYWGRGLATEASKAVVDYCCDAMSVPRDDLYALVQVGHHASRRVLEKTGLIVTGKKEHRGQVVWEMGWETPI